MNSTSLASFIGKKNSEIKSVLLSTQLQYHPAALLCLSGVIYLKVQAVYVPSSSLVVWDSNVPADLLLLLWNVLPLVTAFLIRLLLRGRTQEEEKDQTKTPGCIHTHRNQDSSSGGSGGAFVFLRRLLEIRVSHKIQTSN